MKRVVVTGIGALTPLGNTFSDSWHAMLGKSSGTGPVTAFPAEGLRWPSAGELKGFDPTRWVSLKETRRLDLFVIYAFAAASMAVDDSGIGTEALEDAGIVIGSSRGGIRMLEEAARTRPSAYLMAGSTISMAASYCAMRFGIRGYASGISNACASGASAVGEAFAMIRSGTYEVMLCGGAEAPLTQLCFEGYGNAGAMSPSGRSRPFDRARDGFVLAEGAAVLVLEEYERAVGRGARIYAEISGYGTSCDASHPTVPESEGQSRAIREALRQAGIVPVDVAHIYAHATSTPSGDAVEARTVRQVFGHRGVSVSASKSMTGHMLGASGAVEAALAAMTVSKRKVVPTLDLEDPEPGLEHVTEPRPVGDGAVVSNSFGFGGINAVLIFSGKDL